MTNIAAIVGRPNVGKSTFFNRLVQARQAIVEETSGVTRDRHYGRSDWNGKTFSLIDTGGYVVGSDDIFEEEIRKQVALAIDEADVIFFVVDAREGIHVLDQEVANLLRQSKKKVLLVANKVDNPDRIADAQEFYSFGLGEPFPISAINGSGTGELLDEMVKLLPEEMTTIESDLPKFAVVGRPNVGKSSIINAFLGIERNIVTSIAGTTRDSIHTEYNAFGMNFILVDTAGLRKKGKVYENIEFYSVLRAIRSIEESDVVIILIDAQTGIEAQDLNILKLAEKNRKGVVIVANKWDLIEKENNTHLEYEKAIKERTAPFTDIPIVFTSVINKQRIFKVLEAAHEVYENRNRRIATSQLNELLLPIIQASPPPATTRGKYVKIKYITQLKTQTPQFVFFCNFPKDVKESYRRFLENKLREQFNFKGVPIQLYFRQK
ncbi:MAG TPA: ribosome biogenesis GTPase Der [Bacteroidales bacterium]|jgi:GTP-binding protein|nr:ribosome biogenesis GTPase Der [Bacteroidales bacterium]MDD4088044.1 ribosome biogenesis GTPase Der [Bacteroidales bacterium]MDY0084557.1 ribosome biogenesis GTPase Der [Bacteroidales bacterium]HPE43415.1 ribosome biogenesis GTPase Der [Bacteroidales bacterium]